MIYLEPIHSTYLKRVLRNQFQQNLVNWLLSASDDLHQLTVHGVRDEGLLPAANSDFRIINFSNIIIKITYTNKIKARKISFSHHFSKSTFPHSWYRCGVQPCYHFKAWKGEHHSNIIDGFSWFSGLPYKEYFWVESAWQ